MNDDDLDRRLRAAAASWTTATLPDTTPTSAAESVTIGADRPRRLLVTGIAGLAAAATVAIVTQLPSRTAATPSPPGASTDGSTSTATPSPVPPIASESSLPTRNVAVAPDPCAADPATTRATQLTPTDSVAAMWMCTFDAAQPNVPQRVPQEQLGAFVTAVELPSVGADQCPADAQWPVVGATLGDGRTVLVSLPLYNCWPRKEVSEAIKKVGRAIAIVPSLGSQNVLETLDASRAITLFPGARLVIGSANASGNDRRRELVYAFRNGEIRVTAGCGLATMPLNVGSKRSDVRGEQWYWTPGFRSWEGTPSPDIIVWPVPKADAWIEVEAGDHGQRLLGGSEMPDFTSAITYAGR